MERERDKCVMQIKYIFINRQWPQTYAYKQSDIKRRTDRKKGRTETKTERRGRKERGKKKQAIWEIRKQLNERGRRPRKQ